MGFDDSIILSIKREYSKDEKFAFVLSQLSEVSHELGVVKSDLSEKEYLLEKAERRILALEKQNELLQQENEQLKEDEGESLEEKRRIRLVAKRDEIVLHLKKQLSAAKESIKTLRNTNNTLISKLASRSGPKT